MVAVLARLDKDRLIILEYIGVFSLMGRLIFMFFLNFSSSPPFQLAGEASMLVADERGSWRRRRMRGTGRERRRRSRHCDLK